MTTVSKVLKRQDSGLKLGPGPSGETSINLRQDFLPLLADDLKKGSQQDITFKIYRQDFIDSVEQIKSHLPLYKTTSQSSEQLGTDSAIALEQSLRKEIDDFLSWVLTSGRNHVHNYGLLQIEQELAERQTTKIEAVYTAQTK